MNRVYFSLPSCHQPGLSFPVGPKRFWNASVGWTMEKTDLQKPDLQDRRDTGRSQ